MKPKGALLIVSLCSCSAYMGTAVAEPSLLESILRFAGITVTPSQTRGNEYRGEGDIRMVSVSEDSVSKPQPITEDGRYRTPLWIPHSQSLIAMKGDRLVRVDTPSGNERELHGLSYDIRLIGFDKHDDDRVLVLKDSMVGILSVDSGQIVPVPYESGDPAERLAMDRLNDSSRDYGTIRIFVGDNIEPKSGGGFRALNKIYIETAGVKRVLVDCESACGQPALSEDGRRLLYIGGIDES
ncbi:MAG: hypothetical protein ACU836_04595 [Gammaproteobacteria bacterium]